MFYTIVGRLYSRGMAPRGLRTARRERERDIVDATRALFDEQGLQDAPIEKIARAVGINKALIYRHFESKEELFILTVTRYLEEIAQRLRAEVAQDAPPVEQLERACDAFAGYCLEYPAFLDCAVSLMRRPADELRERVSEAVWLTIGRAMADCLGVSTAILERGAREGAFDIDDPAFTANHLYTQTIGTMHLARLGVCVREAAPGVPEMFRVDPDKVRRAAVADALRAVLPAGTRAAV